MLANSRAGYDLKFIESLPDRDLRKGLELLSLSKAQLRQDLFVLSQTGFKRDGFFVEFGATDGITLSNTWLLEKHFGWSGILAEPASLWHAKLAAERSAQIDFDCVWDKTGDEIVFVQTECAELSTVAEFRNGDHHAVSRKSGKRYAVRTVSLNDLLERHDAPQRMDYLSIDTEGSELRILSSLDFDRYRFSVITCEHNYAANRKRIHSLLTGKGYARKLQDLSDFDDWYVYEG
jgi:FkbM family methyltransferase